MKKRTIIILAGAIILPANLLLTSFYLTANLSEPNSVAIHETTDTKPTTYYPDSAATVSLLVESDIFAFSGNRMDRDSNYSYSDLREILQNHREKHGQNSFVRGKAIPGATQRKIDGVLDEIGICNINRFTIVQPTEKEIKLMESK